ncbi:MAG: MmcQ/YjbR family DNA-binding protein [Sphingobacteriales bacterium]|nr:MmcQ/YjbR family DNA-binding protein [Sphingobacteriales bacterium]
MDIEAIRSYCMAKKGSSESFPFDESTLVIKVMDKMFALISLDRTPFSMNLKCEPEYALELRDRYNWVREGYHMNKKHWNTIDLEAGNIPTALLYSLIDHSYNLVVQSLPKKTQAALSEME